MLSKFLTKSKVHRDDLLVDIAGNIEHKFDDVGKKLTLVDWNRDRDTTILNGVSLADIYRDKGYVTADGKLRNITLEELEVVWKERLIQDLKFDADKQGKVIEHFYKFMHQVGYENMLQGVLFKMGVGKNCLIGGGNSNDVAKTLSFSTQDGKIVITENIEVNNIRDFSNPDVLVAAGHPLMVATGVYELSFDGEVPKCSVKSVILKHNSEFTRQHFDERSIFQKSKQFLENIYETVKELLFKEKQKTDKKVRWKEDVGSRRFLTNKNRALAKELAVVFDDKSVDLFLDSCVLDLSKRTVERSQLLTDEVEGFSGEELERMKKYRVGDIGYSDIGDKEKFGIGDSKDGYILFSNRVSSNGEVRGGLLRAGLDKLKEKSPEMSLYDALTKLLRSTLPMAQKFTNGFLMTMKKSGLLLEEKGNYEPSFNEALGNLAIICTEYVKDGRERGISDEVLKDRLKKIIATEKENIILGGLEYKAFSKDDLLNLIKKAEIDEALMWIADVRSLAKGTINKGSREKIERVAVSAHSLLIWHLSRNSSADHDKGVELTAALMLALENAKSLRIEKFSLKNVLNVFLFIPSIINFVKTHGESFWLRSDSKREVKEYLNLEKAQVVVKGCMKAKDDKSAVEEINPQLEVKESSEVEIKEEDRKKISKEDEEVIESMSAELFRKN